MSVIKRQTRLDYGSDLQPFSTRLPKDTYENLVEWAYKQRFTLAKAASVLLCKAITAEIDTTQPYVTESVDKEGGQDD